MDDLADGIVTEKESIEFMNEGLRQSSSAARQLAKSQNHPIWMDISQILDEIHNTCITLSQAKSLGRQKTLQIINRREGVMAKKLEDTRPVKTPKFLLN